MAHSNGNCAKRQAYSIKEHGDSNYQCDRVFNGCRCQCHKATTTVKPVAKGTRLASPVSGDPVVPVERCKAHDMPLRNCGKCSTKPETRKPSQIIADIARSIAAEADKVRDSGNLLSATTLRRGSRKALREAVYAQTGMRIDDNQARALLRKARAPQRTTKVTAKVAAKVEMATVGTGGVVLQEWTQPYFIRGYLNDEAEATRQALRKATKDVPESVAMVIGSTTRGTATGWKVQVSRRRLPQTTEEFTSAVRGILG